MKCDFRRTSILIFVFITSVLMLTALLITQYIVFNLLPSSIQAKAIKRPPPSGHPSHAPSSNYGNTIPSSQSSAVPPSACINYDPSKRTITTSCSSARLTDIDNKLHDSSILAKQS
ncbi:MAG TPA: hypothetical protein VFI73_04070, partial [Candidatus Nitrosopolaris sp.]|nr:hypothetical protein [Candidatus Nitrosopolaris sp.]